jgi:hypothetical protein
MTNESARPRERTWFGRIAGSLLSWFLFTLCMTLLFKSALAVMALGGSCASGGPYSIEVECPDAVALFTPLSIWGGLAAVAIAIFLSSGFGVSLVDLAWSILFVSLGGGFLYSFFASGDATGLIVGVMFVAMGGIPLVILLRAGVREVFIGTINIRGEKFFVENTGFRIVPRPRPELEATVEPTITDWALSLGIFVIAVYSGYALAEWLYAWAGTW